MGEDIPRRMRRFHRDEEDKEEAIETGGSTEPLAKSILAQTKEKNDVTDSRQTMELALAEIKNFKNQHKRLPKKEEYDTIAENIFNQLKSKRDRERAQAKMERMESRLSKKRFSGRKGKEVKKAEEKQKPSIPGPDEGTREKEVSTTMKKLKGLGVEDLFAEEKETKPISKKAGELDELSKLGIEDLETDSDSMKEISLEKEAEQAPNACPNCKAKGVDIIYCPGCGAAYCKNCATKIEKLADRTKYYCPKCDKSIEK